jgi:protein gp37
MTNPIGWCTKTWNPMTGCGSISEGCLHCYARTMAERFNTGSSKGIRFEPTFHPNRLDIPLHWRKPQRIFVSSMSDLFHKAFTDKQILDVTALCSDAPRHTYIILTKRPERMRDFMRRYSSGPNGPPDNLWLGVTVENQARADERIPVLLDTPAAVRFVCCEPLLGPVDLANLSRVEQFPTDYGDGRGPQPWVYNDDALAGFRATKQGGSCGTKLDWVIVGGENGPGARPMQPEWLYDIHGQCQAAGVPLWFKGWGRYYAKQTWHYGMPDVFRIIERTRELPKEAP